MSENKQAYEISESTDLCKPFSTLSDSASVTVSGRLLSGDMSVCLIGIDEAGERTVLRRDVIAQGDFALFYEIDPISYSVYSGAKSFLISAEPSADARAIIEGADFIENELVTVMDKFGFEGADLNKRSYPVPKKTLFIGNSILLGMDMHYGMCADAPSEDYFYHVCSYIRSMDSDAAFYKLHGGYYEHSESMDAFEGWYDSPNLYTDAPSRESFTEDLDLIIIQLGDNINTDLKYETFLKTGDILIERIKERSPGARIIWVHGWFGRPHIHREICELCLRHGITRVDISDTRDAEAEAHGPIEYIKKNGTRAEIKDTWRTHPGNIGMKRIAERIISLLGF